jgi:hypothetical protein
MDNTEEILFDIIKYGRCKCGAAGDSGHSCPYKSDINNDSNSMRNCCENCAQNCADDI